MKQKAGYTLGILFLGASLASIYTAPATQITKASAVLGIVGGFLVGYTVDVSSLRGDKE